MITASITLLTILLTGVAVFVVFLVINLTDKKKDDKKKEEPQKKTKNNKK